MGPYVKRIGWRPLLGILALSIGLAGGLVSFATGAGPSPSPIPEGCRLQTPQPEAPLKVNAVAAKDLVRTIVMKKEVFECFDATSTLTQIEDVETFVHLIERAERSNTPGVAAIGMRVEAVTCVKDLETGRVTCSMAAVPLGSTVTPLKGCSPTKGTYPFDRVEQPSHPVEMTTRTVTGLLKTTKVENEMFDCAGEIGDMYLFTSIVQEADSTTFTPRGRRFDGLLCLTDEATAALSECMLFTPGAT